MERIGVTDAKAKLLALVRKARAGEATVITYQGEPAARLVPYNEQEDQ